MSQALNKIEGVDMIIKKVISNNALMCQDSNGAEVITIGSGLGFKAKINTEVDENKIEKLYRLSSDSTIKFEKIVNDMPFEHISVADEIIEYAKSRIDNEINDNIYITLTDHINFAIERNKQGISFDNTLLWEIKTYYKKEYEIGLKGLEIIDEKLNIKLDDSEAGFIAMHILNACTYNEITDAIKEPQVISDITKIVEEYFDVKINIESISYERFLMHLKFLVQRVVGKVGYETNESDFHIEFLKNHPNSAKCAQQISDYLSSTYKYDISKEEQMYLALHIERLINREI